MRTEEIVSKTVNAVAMGVLGGIAVNMAILFSGLRRRR